MVVFEKSENLFKFEVGAKFQYKGLNDTMRIKFLSLAKRLGEVTIFQGNL